MEPKKRVKEIYLGPDYGDNDGEESREPKGEYDAREQALGFGWDEKKDIKQTIESGKISKEGQ